MARKALIEKEKRREKQVALRWDQRQELKKIIINPNVDEATKLTAVNKLNSLSRNSSAVRLRNRCQFTGRSRGYLRKFQMSRLCFREMANSGCIPGIVKASW
ncbi:MAG: 30S ribosomal protein S14 [Simkaniaceae bacterium]|nr:30S ribosomal protein S14 [Simkaniaceae bacterium]